MPKLNVARLTYLYVRLRNKRKSTSGAEAAPLAEVALAWLITREGVTAPIASATTVEQVDSLIRATRLTQTAANLALLDDASSFA